MEKSPLIYIDHNATTLKDEMKDFVDKLKARISRINPDLKILTYEDIHDDSIKHDDEKYVEILMSKAADAISNSFITLAIIDNSYLNTASYSNRFLNEIEIINKAKNRYFFPIIFDKTNWLSAKWLVKLKLYPSSSSYKELESEKKDNLIEDLGERIEAIVSLPQNSELTSTFESLDKPKPVVDKRTIFISHAHDDADFAELLQLKLKDQGISSWVDSERLKIGQDWREEIDKGIEEALALIVIMTPEAKSSEYVTYEWAYAYGLKKPIFPIMLKLTPLHPRLESMQYLNFTLKASRPYVDLFDSLNGLHK